MEPAVQVDDKLILVITTARIVFINITNSGWVDAGWDKVSAIQWSNSTARNTRNEASWQWCVQRSRPQYVQRANVNVASGDCDIARQLTFDANHRLQRIGSLQVIRQFIN